MEKKPKTLKQCTKKELIDQVASQQEKYAELFRNLVAEKRKSREAEEIAAKVMEQSSLLVNSILSKIVEKYGDICIDVPDVTNYKEVFTRREKIGDKTYFTVRFAESLTENKNA